MLTHFHRRARIMPRPLVPVAAIAFALVFQASLPLAAQGPAVREQQPTAPGWVFTPGIGVAQIWDNNVLLSTEGSGSVGDFLTAISPRAGLGFRGPRSTFNLDYRGFYQLYQDLSELNAFDQRLNINHRQLLTPRLSFVAKNSLSKSPTTDEVDIPGVLFRRQGVVMDDFRAGLEARVNRRTTVNGAYTFQWLDFEEIEQPIPNPSIEALERGGHAHGAVAEVDHVLGPRLTVGAEYEMRHALVDQAREFDTQNALGTVDWRLDERLTLSGGAGYAWLTTNLTEEGRSAPTFRVSLSRSGAQLAWNVAYRRSFLPSFGFGGTFQNEEFHASAFGPITRRLDWSASGAVLEADALTRSTDPLLSVDAGLRSVYLRSSLSYLATRWMRVEGYYVAAFQDSGRAGGKVNRSRAGVQVVTHTRTRIR
jgi:hypothetical protein